MAKIVPGGQSQRAGLRENDKIVRINNKVRRYTSKTVELSTKFHETFENILRRPQVCTRAISFLKASTSALILHNLGKTFVQML